MTHEQLWYAAYEIEDADGYDADYESFGTRARTEAFARRVYLPAVSEPVDNRAVTRAFVYLVPVDASVAGKDDANGDPWSLWDALASIPREQWVFLHGSPDEYHGDAKEGGAA